MRLADTIFRQGHLAEQALVDVWMTGDRPAHLDRCDICADRADEMAAWLDGLRETGIETADAAFPAERLAAQQSAIMSRLEHMDRPSRVLSFPRPSRTDHAPVMRGGLKTPWLVGAVAAGLVIGIATGQIGSRLFQRETPSHQVQAAGIVPTSITADDAALLDASLDRITPESLRTIEELTPHAADIVLASVKR